MNNDEIIKKHYPKIKVWAYGELESLKQMLDEARMDEREKSDDDELAYLKYWLGR